MEYLFHKWPRITIQSFYHRVCNKSNMTCVISHAGTVTLPEYLSSLLVFSELGNKSNMTCVISDAGTVTLPEYSSSHLAFSELGLTQSLVSFVVFCRSLSFCLIFRLTIVLTIVLSFDLATSDYSFGIFQPLLHKDFNLN
jgi:hypothetical protein